MSPVIKWIDLPPLWLALFLGLGWVQAHNLPVGPDGGPPTELVGGLSVGTGILMMLLAAMEMRRARTTILPHQDPEALVTSGIFGRTRNPIYLGDTMVLAGFLLRWEAWPALVLVPLFIWLITDRFIAGEERRLQHVFGRGFDDYAARVRRWI